MSQYYGSAPVPYIPPGVMLTSLWHSVDQGPAGYHQWRFMPTSPPRSPAVHTPAPNPQVNTHEQWVYACIEARVACSHGHPNSAAHLCPGCHMCVHSHACAVPHMQINSHEQQRFVRTQACTHTCPCAQKNHIRSHNPIRHILGGGGVHCARTAHYFYTRFPPKETPGPPLPKAPKFRSTELPQLKINASYLSST